MDTAKFDRLLAFHCGPALAGIKPANLVSCSKILFPDLAALLRLYNRSLNPCGIFLEIVCECSKNFLLLLYRREKLLNCLERDFSKETLREEGYPIAGSLERLLSHLKKRLQNSKNFPHEIGIFLGYPPEDVAGFREKKGKDFLLCGYWKVYGNPAEAQELFRRYDRCRSALCRHVSGGASILQLFDVKKQFYLIKEAI